MSVEVFQLQADSVSAEELRRSTYLTLARNASGTIGTVAGGVVPGTAGDLAVTAPASGLSVNVAAGECVVPGSALYASVPSGYYLRNTGTLNVTGFTANPSNPTIYALVATINDAAYHGAVNSGVIQSVAGTPTTGATLANLSGAPSIPDASLLLAWILVPTSATSIITADIANVARLVTVVPIWNVVTDSAGGTISTALSGDSRMCNATTASTTYSGLSGAPGARYRFAREDGSSNTCTIDAPAGGNIVGPGVAAGVSSIPLNAAGAFVELVGDGTNLRIIGGALNTGNVQVTSFTNGFSAGQSVYYRAIGNRVRVIGAVTGGTAATVAFTLPSLYAPSTAEAGTFPAQEYGSGGTTLTSVGVATSGAVTPATGASWLGFEFLTD